MHFFELCLFGWSVLCHKLSTCKDVKVAGDMIDENVVMKHVATQS